MEYNYQPWPDRILIAVRAQLRVSLRVRFCTKKEKFAIWTTVGEITENKRKKRKEMNYKNSMYGLYQGGEDSYMEQTGMLVGNFEFNP